LKTGADQFGSYLSKNLSKQIWKGLFNIGKVLVLYYSKDGNTEKMANLVAEGAAQVLKLKLELNQSLM
jgi:hypothetical protein